MTVKQKLHEAAVSLTQARDALENAADWQGLDHIDSVLDHLYLVQKSHAVTENR